MSGTRRKRARASVEETPPRPKDPPVLRLEDIFLFDDAAPASCPASPVAHSDEHRQQQTTQRGSVRRTFSRKRPARHRRSPAAVLARV